MTLREICTEVALLRAEFGVMQKRVEAEANLLESFIQSGQVALAWRCQLLEQLEEKNSLLNSVLLKLQARIQDEAGAEWKRGDN